MSELGKLEWDKHKFAVWGGKLNPNEWLAFLDAWKWKDDKRWRILEFVSDFKIDDGAMPLEEKDIPLLERVELFGKSGHLSSRRDGEWVYWHFVGETTIIVPQGYEHTESYWEKHSEDKFRRAEKEQRMLLWGERIKAGDDWMNEWFDDRVAWAELKYPHIAPPQNGTTENHSDVAEQESQRVQANYWQFTCAGQVAFVWLTGLTEFQAKEA
ncbi:hypothetical protein KJ068_29475 [bacterium]|nr:hypothetical protein [bacterium]